MEHSSEISVTLPGFQAPEPDEVGLRAHLQKEPHEGELTKGKDRNRMGKNITEHNLMINGSRMF